jgi:hypothetical protein
LLRTAPFRRDKKKRQEELLSWEPPESVWYLKMQLAVPWTSRYASFAMTS